MRRVQICILVAASAAIMLSRVRFVRQAFDPAHQLQPAPAAESPYGPDSISESAVDTGKEKLEPERKPDGTQPAGTPAPRPPGDDF